MIRFSLTDMYHHLQSSYWFLPLMMVIGAIALSLGTLYIDSHITTDWLHSISWLGVNEADGARSVLSTIAGSMITVAGVTFSMTIVSVSFASSQFGPRLIGNFMADKGNQLTLGTFIATFVYCLMILRSVRTVEFNAKENMETLVPHISVLCGMSLTLASMMVLIYFIHHVPESINISNITSGIGARLKRDLTHLFPEHIGEAEEGDNDKDHNALTQRAFAYAMKSHSCGFIESLDQSALMSIAIEHDFTIILRYRPGDYCIEHETMATIYSETSITPEIRDAVLTCFTWGQERTPHQNAMFLVDQLLEIIARALSPGVNDPYTALNCMNWLKSALAQCARNPAPSSRRVDETGVLRVISRAVTFESMCERIFDTSLQYISADRNATLHMLKIISDVGIDVSSDKQIILLKYADILCAAATETLPYSHAREEVKLRTRQIASLFKDPSRVVTVSEGTDWPGGHG